MPKPKGRWTVKQPSHRPNKLGSNGIVHAGGIKPPDKTQTRPRAACPTEGCHSLRPTRFTWCFKCFWELLPEKMRQEYFDACRKYDRHNEKSRERKRAVYAKCQRYLNVRHRLLFLSGKDS